MVTNFIICWLVTIIHLNSPTQSGLRRGRLRRRHLGRLGGRRLGRSGLGRWPATWRRTAAASEGWIHPKPCKNREKSTNTCENNFKNRGKSSNTWESCEELSTFFGAKLRKNIGNLGGKTRFLDGNDGKVHDKWLQMVDLWVYQKEMGISLPKSQEHCQGLENPEVDLVMEKTSWLVASTPLKNISQLGLSNIWKNRKCSKPPTSKCLVLKVGDDSNTSGSRLFWDTIKRIQNL